MAEEKEKPLTREDVLKAIEKNGGTAKGLDLSGKTFEARIDLSRLDLRGIILVKAILHDANLQKADLMAANLQQAILVGANLQQTDFKYANLHQADLWGANLQQAYLRDTNLPQAKIGNANLRQANLEFADLQQASLVGASLQKATLWRANLQEANLRDANLQEANLGEANLEGAYCSEIKLSPETTLDDTRWGHYILGEERDGDFDSASDTYRRLKIWYTNAGIYDTAGEFFYREMETKRKAMKWWPDPFPRAWSTFLALLVGYGERPLRVLASVMAAFLSLTAIYWLVGGLTLSYSLYFSAISFTALGYGNWVKDVDITGWMQGVGAFESFIGILMIVLFSITFTRKMTR